MGIHPANLRAGAQRLLGHHHAVRGGDRLRQADVRILGAVLNRYRSAHSGLGKRYRSYETYVTAEKPPSSQAGSAA